jgi:hypothetical protein
MASSENGPPIPEALSNFANLPFSSPDPSSIPLLWNAAQPFLTTEVNNIGDGILLPNGSGNGVATSTVVVQKEDVMRAHEYLTAVSLRIDSLEMAVRYSCLSGMGQLMAGEEGNGESWNVLLPQVMDVVGVSFD